MEKPSCMDEILKIDTIDRYNKLFGFETRHPLVGVVRFDTAEKAREMQAWLDASGITDWPAPPLRTDIGRLWFGGGR